MKVLNIFKSCKVFKSYIVSYTIKYCTVLYNVFDDECFWFDLVIIQLIWQETKICLSVLIVHLNKIALVSFTRNYVSIFALAMHKIISVEWFLYLRYRSQFNPLCMMICCILIFIWLIPERWPGNQINFIYRNLNIFLHKSGTPLSPVPPFFLQRITSKQDFACYDSLKKSHLFILGPWPKIFANLEGSPPKSESSTPFLMTYSSRTI